MEALQVLADPVRLGIVESLAHEPASVGVLAERFPISRPAVSRHLRLLKDAGLVDSVSDVLALTRDEIKAAPELNSSIDATFITGIGTVKSGHGEKDTERMLILMDIEALMSSADMGLIAN